MKHTIQIESKYYPYLAKIFSRKVMADLARYGKSGYLNEIMVNSGFIKLLENGFRLVDIFNAVYECILRHYRNEYVYKNAIANKILLGRHSLNTSFMLTEFRVAGCKADVVILNGTSNVYEIKTELDSLDRLAKQVGAYQKFFDKVHIISSPNQVKKIENLVNPNIGILELTSRNTIKSVREAASGKENVSPEIIFDSLRKAEYTSMIQELVGPVPDVPNTQIYRECRKIFQTLPPEMVHDAMVRHLKRRGNNTALKKLVASVPHSLKAFALNACLTHKEADSFLKLLNSRYTDLCPNVA